METNTSMSGSELRCGYNTEYGCKRYVDQPCIIILALGPHRSDVLFHADCVPEELETTPAFLKNWRAEREAQLT